VAHFDCLFETVEQLIQIGIHSDTMRAANILSLAWDAAFAAVNRSSRRAFARTVAPSNVHVLFSCAA
jgi:hypothetical protein